MSPREIQAIPWVVRLQAVQLLSKRYGLFQVLLRLGPALGGLIKPTQIVVDAGQLVEDGWIVRRFGEQFLRKADGLPVRLFGLPGLSELKLNHPHTAVGKRRLRTDDGTVASFAEKLLIKPERVLKKLPAHRFHLRHV